MHHKVPVLRVWKPEPTDSEPLSTVFQTITHQTENTPTSGAWQVFVFWPCHTSTRKSTFLKVEFLLLYIQPQHTSFRPQHRPDDVSLLSSRVIIFDIIQLFLKAEAPPDWWNWPLCPIYSASACDLVIHSVRSANPHCDGVHTWCLSNTFRQVAGKWFCCCALLPKASPS